MKDTSFFKKVKKIEIIASKLVENLFSGNYRSVFKGQGIEFDEVREYVLSDDSRLIDWNVTSRMGSPYTKVFREEREMTLFLIIDMSASVFNGSGDKSPKEIINLIFAILGISAVVNNDRVGGVLFSDRIEKWIPPAKGKKHVLRMIHDIIGLKPGGKGSELGLALKTVYESLKRRGICVIISDFKTTDYWDQVTLLSRKHDVIAVRVSDPIDETLPSTGAIELEDPESGKIMMIGGPFDHIDKRYKEFWECHYREWYQNCHRRGIQTLEIGTGDDPGKKLYEFFQRRRR